MRFCNAAGIWYEEEEKEEEEEEVESDWTEREGGVLCFALIGDLVRAGQTIIFITA